MECEDCGEHDVTLATAKKKPSAFVDGERVTFTEDEILQVLDSKPPALEEDESRREFPEEDQSYGRIITINRKEEGPEPTDDILDSEMLQELSALLGGGEGKQCPGSPSDNASRAHVIPDLLAD